VQDATALVAGAVKSVLTDHHGEFILAISGQGDVTYLQRVDADGGKLAVRQTFRPFADKAGTTGDASISAAFLLFGDVSLVAVDARGANRIFSLHRKPGEQQRTWGLTRELDPLPGTIRFSSHSTRNKSFLLGSDQCVSLRHATSAAVRWEQPAEVQPLMGVLGPKYDRIAVLGADRQVRLWPLHDRHPEAGLRAFFGEVWYEGYSEPRHEWQSTGGTDDFEPKLSMVVLMWGTLKATFYALLFAIPIALLGAIYTAEFMHPRFKAIIKPTVEIMAALPSVVLGFLAALWLAPAIENRFPSVLMVFLLVPLAACAIGFTWSRLPPSARALVRPGREFLALGPVLLLVAWLGWLMGPVVERLFFTVQIDGAAVADFRRWWAATTGLAYEQRNSLVVGVMMGFAVIPIIFTIAEDALSNVPPALRSGSLALGASRWQTALRVVMPTASPGIFSGMMIGLGRAIGETMIVVMATGNTGIIDWNPFNGMRTLSANIAVELPEAPHGSTLYRSLFLGALLLFIFTFAVNTAAEILRTRLREKYKTV
jgi:phosphate transport system permease protein